MLATIAKDPATLAQGKDVFVSTCAPCHKPDGGGNIGPNLTDAYWIHGSKPTDIYRTVTEGVPAKGMPTWAPVLGEQRVEAVVAYVISIENTNVPGGKAPQGELAREVTVANVRLPIVAPSESRSCTSAALPRDGRRHAIQPADVRGRFHRARSGRLRGCSSSSGPRCRG